ERELRLADAELALRLGKQTDETEQALKDVLDEATAAGDTKSSVRATVALGLSAASAARIAEAIERLEPATQSLSPARRPDVYEALGRSYPALGDTRPPRDLFAPSPQTGKGATPDDTATPLR